MQQKRLLGEHGQENMVIFSQLTQGKMRIFCKGQKLTLLFILMTFLLFNCKEEDITKNSEGAITSMPYKWKASVSENGSSFPFFFTPLVYKDGVMFYSAYNDDEFFLSFKNLDNGEEIWRWDDQIENGRWDVGTYHINDGKLAFNNGTYFYALDLETGKTIWKRRQLASSFLSLAGLHDNYYFAGNLVGEFMPKIFGGNFENSGFSELFLPDIDSTFLFGDFSYGFVQQMITLENDQQDALLFVPFSESLSMIESKRFITLYNLTTKEKVYDKIEVVTKSDIPFQGIPKISGDKIYFSVAENLMCYDVFTGKKKWSRSFDNMLIRYTVAEGKVFALCEDTYLYAYDAETGSLLWKEKAAGLPSELVYMNGVLYFTAAGDGYLHAVDTETGKHIWLLRCPDEKINSKAFFKLEGVAVLPGENGEKGRVFASGYLNAYCYEAAK